MARKTKRPLARPKTNGDFWAFVTLLSFPLALLVANALGYGTLGSFLWGMAGSLGALTANAITEGRLWMFDPKWSTRFEHPEFSFRLALVTGTILLILESAVLVMLFAGGAESNMMGLVYERHCRPAETGYIEFCDMLDRTIANQAR